MFNPTQVVIDGFVNELHEMYKQTYGILEPSYPGIMSFVARLALENIANSDAAYHDMNHTIMRLGLAALNSYQPLRDAITLQQELRDRFDETFVLSVWGTQGPTIVRVDESSQPIIMCGDGTPLFLQLKEAGTSVLERLGPKFKGHQGQRVVEGQRVMKS